MFLSFNVNDFWISYIAESKLDRYLKHLARFEKKVLSLGSF